MAGRTPHEAVAVFQDSLCRALACITEVVPQVVWSGTSGQLLAATLNEGDPISLRSQHGYSFSMAMEYRVVEESRRIWAVRVASYEYTVYGPNGRELLIYHWHPEWVGQVAFPHFHLEWHLLSEEQRGIFSHRHLPSGSIVLEDVIWMLIEEIGVSPMPSHEQSWAQTLRKRDDVACSRGTERWRVQLSRRS